MSDPEQDVLRIQLRLYRSDDPRLFADLHQLSTKNRHRRVRQLMQDGFYGGRSGIKTEGPMLAVVSEGASEAPSKPRTPKANGVSALTSLPTGFQVPSTLKRR